jgi:predicted LPLAT superfamily acyltransferase
MVPTMNWHENPERGGRVAFLGMQLLFWLYRHGGRPLFSLFLYPVMLWFFLFGRVARNASLEYLGKLKRFYPELPINPDLRCSWKHFLTFADTLLDKLKVWTGSAMIAATHRHGREQMLELLNAGRGGVMLTAHLGNTEAMQVMSELNPQLKLNVLVYTKHAMQFNRVLSAHARDHNIRFMSADDIGPDAAVLLAQRVAAGEWVVIAADRVPMRNERRIKVNFLGESAYLPLGPHLLALLLKCPLIFAVCLKQDNGLNIYFEDLSRQSQIVRAGRTAFLQDSAQRYADTLANYCRIAPLQWSNFYPFWSVPAESMP